MINDDWSWQGLMMLYVWRWLMINDDLTMTRLGDAICVMMTHDQWWFIMTRLDNDICIMMTHDKWWFDYDKAWWCSLCNDDSWSMMSWSWQGLMMISVWAWSNQLHPFVNQQWSWFSCDLIIISSSFDNVVLARDTCW